MYATLEQLQSCSPMSLLPVATQRPGVVLWLRESCEKLSKLLPALLNQSLVGVSCRGRRWHDYRFFNLRGCMFAILPDEPDIP